jgi:hypothetical protein
LSDKAAGHTVIPTAAGFEVVSGTSGSKYLVAPLYSGGAACTCAYAKRQTRIAVECSHVLAVVAFAGKITPPRAVVQECSVCGGPVTHGCNTGACSQSCEDEAEAMHERAHAGISDPDACDRGPDCPAGGR